MSQKQREIYAWNIKQPNKTRSKEKEHVVVLTIKDLKRFFTFYDSVPFFGDR